MHLDIDVHVYARTSRRTGWTAASTESTIAVLSARWWRSVR
jgi:hypothetical protein